MTAVPGGAAGDAEAATPCSEVCDAASPASGVPRCVAEGRTGSAAPLTAAGFRASTFESVAIVETAGCAGRLERTVPCSGTAGSCGRLVAIDGGTDAAEFAPIEWGAGTASYGAAVDVERSERVDDAQFAWSVCGAFEAV